MSAKTQIRLSPIAPDTFEVFDHRTNLIIPHDRIAPDVIEVDAEYAEFASIQAIRRRRQNRYVPPLPGQLRTLDQ